MTKPGYRRIRLIGQDISAKFDLDERLAYQWVVVSGTDLRKARFLAALAIRNHNITVEECT